MIPRSAYWTEEEIERLKKLFSQSPLEIIKSALPRRKLSAIRKKAFRLGLRREVDGLYKEVKPLDCLTDFEIGYIAGIIDGEGCIFLRRYKGGTHCNITVGNISEELIDWLAEKILGGNKKVAHRKIYRNCYYYVISSNHILIALLQVIMPHLKVKKKQAELLLQFLKLQRARKRVPIYDYEKHRYKGTRVIRNPEENKVYEKFQELNS